MADSSDYNHLIKLLLIGDSAVGKSSLLMRFCDDKFEQNFMITIGVDFKMKTVTREHKKLRLQIWDTAGQERFRTITPAYYRSAMGVILTYDLTDESSFHNVQFWMDNLEQHGEANAQCVLVGNKADLEDKRQVSREQAEEFAQKHGMVLFETSAKTNTEVDTAFNHIADLVFEKRFADLPGRAGIKDRVALSADAKHDKDGKCKC
eukprot:GEMP01088947.1.p1 GENE.GEMP01088947.1~~GEMP01088947.1.p1  ORF type:complete len:206 (+),score=56.61 GEMP01088947.1:192-809(+)